MFAEELSSDSSEDLPITVADIGSNPCKENDMLEKNGENDHIAYRAGLFAFMQQLSKEAAAIVAAIAIHDNKKDKR